MPDYENSLVVLSKDGINAKSVGNTTLAVTENGTQRFMPFYVTVEATTSTAITVGATVNVGTNSTNFDNMISGTTTPTAANGFNILASSSPTSLAANTTITVRVSAAATGTAQTIRVDVLGYYV